MRSLKKFERAVPATTSVYVEEPKENASIEKNGAETALESGHSDHVHPEIERMVISKFDWHLVPLVTALCLCVLMSSLITHVLIPYNRPSFFSGSVKYRVRKPVLAHLWKG